MLQLPDRGPRAQKPSEKVQLEAVGLIASLTGR